MAVNLFCALSCAMLKSGEVLLLILSINSIHLMIHLVHLSAIVLTLSDKSRRHSFTKGSFQRVHRVHYQVSI